MEFNIEKKLKRYYISVQYSLCLLMFMFMCETVVICWYVSQYRPSTLDSLLWFMSMVYVLHMLLFFDFIKRFAIERG